MISQDYIDGLKKAIEIIELSIEIEEDCYDSNETIIILSHIKAALNNCKLLICDEILQYEKE